MNESMWMYFFMLIGILGIVIINIFGQVIVSNEQNYYLLKEVTEAAMYDSVDYYAYRDGVGWDGVTKETSPDSMHCESNVPGTVRIIREKFVESFLRRFAQNADLNRQYRVIIHDLDECPPKVSISLIASERFSMLQLFNVHYSSSQDVINTITGILENIPPEQ